MASEAGPSPRKGNEPPSREGGGRAEQPEPTPAVSGQHGQPAPAPSLRTHTAEGLAFARALDATMLGMPVTPSTEWAAAAVTEAQVARLAQDYDWHGQVLQAVKLQWRDGVGDARMTLRPDNMGEITVALRVSQGAVSVQVSAQTPEVRSWLSANESGLRQGLIDQGLSLDRLVVTKEATEQPAEGEGRRRGTPQDAQPEQQTQARQKRRTDATFEVVV